MALQNSHSAAVGVPERWLLTCSATQADRLPGTLLIPEDREWLSITRVIFLVPDSPVEIDRVTQAFAALNIPRGTPVVLAELAGSKNDSAKRRHFKALVAGVREVYPAACGERFYDTNWPEAMRAFTEQQDLLIAAAGQRLPQGIFAGRTLSQALLDLLHLPVLEIAGIFPPWHSRLLGWISRALFNLFPLLVVGGFFWIQAQIDRQAQGWVSMFALGATVIVEFTVIFVWSLFLE